MCETAQVIKSSEYKSSDKDEQKEASRPVEYRLLTLPIRYFRQKRSKQLENHSQINLEIVEQLEDSIFMVGLSVIISALIQMRSSTGLTPYHALIILNIGLINNAAGLLMWMARSDVDSIMFILFQEDHPRGRDALSKAMKAFFQNFWRIAHSMLLAGFGICSWIFPDGFTSKQSPCLPPTYYWVFGLRFPVLNRTLRLYSVTFYLFSLYPSYPFAMTMQVFIGAVAILTFLAKFIAILVSAPFQGLADQFPARMRGIFESVLSPFTWFQGRLRKLSKILFSLTASAWVAFLGCSLFIVYMAVCTEMTIKINDVAPGEDKWTYGQIVTLSNAVFTFAGYGKRWFKE
ncbi:hypothetical protein L218DRAFT_947498 [Marasmius fiardii PR-910]|nr:hypothetical protein L218DRAFT_947498 [Marasmius fiardii PR-910]